MTMLRELWKDEGGASLIEYVLIAGLISIAGWATWLLIRGDLTTILNNVNTATADAATAT
jgi:Flp pilus assembly pilin Flp